MEKLIKILLVGTLISFSSAFAEEADDIEFEIEHELSRQLEEIDVELAEGDPAVGEADDIASLEELKSSESKASQMSAAEKETYKVKVVKGLNKRVAKQKRSKRRAKRRPASSFKQGFKRLRRNCAMHSKANGNSAKVLQLKKGKKLWVEHHGLWMKGFRKNGAGFISAKCF